MDNTLLGRCKVAHNDAVQWEYVTSTTAPAPPSNIWRLSSPSPATATPPAGCWGSSQRR